MKKKCKCIKEYNKHDFKYFKQQNIYYYKLSTNNIDIIYRLYPYKVFLNKKTTILFNKQTFYNHFQDVQQLRKNKLKLLNEKLI